MTYADADSTLRTAAGSIAFQHTAQGVASQTVSGTTTQFLRDASGNLVSMRVGSTSYWYLADGLGSIVGVIETGFECTGGDECGEAAGGLALDVASGAAGRYHKSYEVFGDLVGMAVDFS